MKNNSVLFLRALVVFAALQFPVAGYCDSGSGLFKNLFESKGKNMKEVAVKVAELHEDQNIEIWGLDFSPDGKYLAATSPTTLDVQIWDWQNKRIVRTLERAQGSGFETDIRYSPDGHLLVACHNLAQGDVVIRIWNTDTWKIVHDITAINDGSCKAIGFTPDGKSLIGVHERNPVAAGDTLTVYDTTTWQPMWGLRTVPFHPKALAISPNGKFAAIGGGKYDNKGSLTQQIALVDLVQREIVRTIQNTVDFDNGHLAWSSDGAYITAIGRRGLDIFTGAYTSGLDSTMIFDAHTGKQVAGEQFHDEAATKIMQDIEGASLRYTPDGKYLIESFWNGRGSGRGVRIWDGRHRELLQEIPGEVVGLALSRDGHYFAVSTYKQISVWQLK